MDKREADSFEPASLLRGNREIQGFLRKKVIPSGLFTLRRLRKNSHIAMLVVDY